MLRLSLKNVWSRKGRLILTALAVIAGTAFLSGVFVFTDTVQASFDRMFAEGFKNTDAFVRASRVVEGEFGEDQRPRIDQSYVERVAAMPHVVEAEPVIQGIATMSKDGKVIGATNGPPKFGASWTGSDVSPFALAEGEMPSGSKIAIDRGSAKSAKLKIGDTVSVQAAGGVRDFTVAGIVTYAGADSSMGVTWALFDVATAQEFVTKDPGKIDGIAVRGDGTESDQQLAAGITAALATPDLEVKTGAEITAENKDAVAAVLNVITIAFSVFAMISLFVGSFIIYNVFSISAAQRTRENALLRAVGASRAQVTRSMFVEALIVGIVGSLIGCIAGLGLATLILAVMRSNNMLTDTQLSIEPTGFVITLIVGVLVTLVCAIAPALRSGRVPPLAAMRDVATDSSDVSRRRLVLGVVTLAGAIAAVVLGLGGNATWLGVGAGLLFLTVIVLGPLLAGPFSRVMTPIMSKLRPVAGTVAGRNAARNPKRTALTAGALAIVVALFIGVATLGSSAKATTSDVVGKTFASDYAVTSGQGQSLLPPTLATDLEQAGVGDVLVLTGTRLTIDGKARNVMAIDGQAASRVLRFDFVSGGFADLTTDGLIVSKDEAANSDLQMGSTVQATLLNGDTHTLTVQGIVDNETLGRRFVARDLFAGRAPLFDFALFVKSNGAADTEAKMQAVVDKYPGADLQTRDEFVASQSGQIDSFLNLIYALLAMSLFIAVIGIVITLLLAVYERRRELGLMRAVGMTRRQVRSSVLWESVVTALIGSALGVALGVALGWIIVSALKDDGLSKFSLPVGTVVAAAIGAVVLAALAAFLPARRAAKADILQAIATT